MNVYNAIVYKVSYVPNQRLKQNRRNSLCNHTVLIIFSFSTSYHRKLCIYKFCRTKVSYVTYSMPHNNVLMVEKYSILITTIILYAVFRSTNEYDLLFIVMELLHYLKCTYGQAG